MIVEFGILGNYGGASLGKDSSVVHPDHADGFFQAHASGCHGFKSRQKAAK